MIKIDSVPVFVKHQLRRNKLQRPSFSKGTRTRREQGTNEPLGHTALLPSYHFQTIICERLDRMRNWTPFGCVLLARTSPTSPPATPLHHIDEAAENQKLSSPSFSQGAAPVEVSQSLPQGRA